MNNNQSGIDTMPITCPKCGRMSDSIKCYSLPNYILFIGIYIAYEFKRDVCCPACMRKQILLKYFTYNILIGNIVWLVLGLPMGIWKLCSSFTRGHSVSVKKILAQNIADAERQARQRLQEEESHVDQNGNPVYNIKYGVNPS